MPRLVVIWIFWAPILTHLFNASQVIPRNELSLGKWFFHFQLAWAFFLVLTHPAVFICSVIEPQPECTVLLLSTLAFSALAGVSKHPSLFGLSDFVHVCRWPFSIPCFALVDKYETSGTTNTITNHTLKIMAIKQHRQTLNVMMSQCRREGWKRQVTWTVVGTEIGYNVHQKMHPCSVYSWGILNISAK